ncbi:MAG TPA: protein kinase, partial [Vicinamibacterales bacterium]|nr:protein kinase [Vicinamibacterales bacterium]
MGALFLAHDPDIDRLVAIKVLREGLDTGDLRERFRREARAAGRLRHPNIVTIFDVGEYEGQPFIAMEYLPGETLAELIKRKAPLSLRRKLKLLEEVCDGLAYAHKSGIVHRDVKPANLMVEPDGVLKILDFGIVRIAESGMTQAGMLVGTLNYMSPEQVSGAQVDLRSDIFAVGAVGYELLKYEQAFPGTLQDGILYRIMNADPPPIDPALAPPGVYGIILRAIQKDPSKRYRDLGAMRKDLERCRTALPLDEDPADARDDVETEVISTGPLSRGDKPSTGAEKRRAVLIERHLKTAEDALAAGDYRLALSSAEELMILDPAHEAGAQILNEAHAAVLLEEVRAELQRAREQLGRGEVDDAYEVVQRAAARLEDRASSQVEAEFRALREDLERARERQRLIRGALSRASASLQGEAYESAIRASNEILALEPSHPEALRIRADATSAVDRRANAGVAAARARFAGGDHQGAIHLLETAPSHPKVTSALAELRRSAREIAEQREAEEREARLKAERQAQRAEAAAHAVEAALAAGDIDRAESLLGDLRGLASDSSRIPPLVEAIAAARAEAHRRSVRAAVDRLLNDAEERIAAGELDGARSALGRIAELAPNGPAATALRAQLKDRECALAEQKAQAAAALQRSDFRAARAAIAGARAISVSDADVAVLTQDLERAEAASIREAETRRAFEEALSRAQGALGKGELALALEAATAAARLLPADSRAIEIRQRVESARAEAQRRQDQIAAQLKELRRLAKRRDFAAASAAADALLRFDPENAEAQQVREEIAHALAEAEAARLAREQSEAERRRAGEEALALADEAVAAGELDRAGEAVSTAGQNLPGDRRVSELRQRVDSARLEMRRRQDQIEEQLRALRRLAHSGDFAAATAAADALLQFDPGNADAMRILDEIAETRAAAEAARIAHERSEAERRRAGEEALALADGALAAGELDRAGEAVSTAGQHLPGDRRVIELQQRVDSARVEARRRQDQIEEHLRALRRLTHSGDFAAATAAADALLQFDPGNADAERILDEIAETRAAAEAARLARERSEAESRRAFEGELSRAEDALAAGELAAAIEAANAAGQRMPEDPRAIDLQRRVEDAWADARQRQDQIAAQLKELRRLTKKRDFTAATAAVEALLR